MRSFGMYILRLYLRLGLFFYFRSIKINQIDKIRKDKAVLILCNHQNALLDALVIATSLPKYGYFLTRASVFKKKFVSSLLRGINMLPVFRIRDGWANLSNNNPIFDRCTELLVQKNILVMFPEGSHNLVRRVRPLSKGFTRIVFDSIEKNSDLNIDLLPAGLSYQDALKWPDELVLNFGEPICTSNFSVKDRLKETPRMRKLLHEKIKELTVHIPEENYEELHSKLEMILTDFTDVDAVNKCIESSLENCDLKTTKETTVGKILKLVLILNLLLPYALWKGFLEPKVTELEFRSTFRFAVAIVLVPLYLILIGLVIGLNFGTIKAFAYVLFVLLIDLMLLKIFR